MTAKVLQEVCALCCHGMMLAASHLPLDMLLLHNSLQVLLRPLKSVLKELENTF